MTTNKAVIEAWKNGRAGAARNLSTNGRDLWSYGLQIGQTDAEGHKLALNYRTGGVFVSTTTSTHVGMAILVADKVLDAPPVPASIRSRV